MDTVTRTLEHLQSLSREQVAHAWDEVRDGPGWTIVLVGDPEHAEGLEELATQVGGGFTLTDGLA